MKILITGASKGIGKGIARVLAENGHSLGLIARSQSLLEELQKELGSRTLVSARSCDLRSWDNTQKSVLALVEELRGVDALINNAGLVLRKDIVNISIEEWHSIIETNINGIFYTIKALLPQLQRQGHGHIINVSSISGKVPLPGGSAYAASKFAVSGFSQSLFHELRDLGIKVSTIYPGSVDSESHRHSESDASWKIQPEEVGVVCQQLLETSKSNCISEVEIRPLKRPGG